jgi:uncharacterized membrane protein
LPQQSLPHSDSAAQADEKETGRLEAFSDGVYAVAITLLVLDLQVPKLTNNASGPTVAAALLRQWPSYLAFITSFFSVLIMWINHHAIFKLVQRTNARLLFANGLLLMITTVVPFSTSLVTQYLQYPAAKVACAVYGATFVLISLAYALLWYGLRRDGGLFRPDASQEVIERIDHNYRVGPPAYILATVGAFVSPYVTIAICTGLWIFWALTARGESDD